MAVKKSTRTAAKKAPKAPKAITDPYSKTELLTHLAETVDLSRKEIANVLEALSDIIHGHIRKRGAGTFTLPGLMKITIVDKPAKKARKGINPFTGEETVFKAKPAQRVVRVKALKKLKDMAV